MIAQVDTGLTRRHGGTGLGLYTSSQLAKLLGGRIEVQSELGKGSTRATNADRYRLMRMLVGTRS